SAALRTERRSARRAGTRLRGQRASTPVRFATLGDGRGRSGATHRFGARVFGCQGSTPPAARDRGSPPAARDRGSLPRREGSRVTPCPGQGPELFVADAGSGGMGLGVPVLS